MAAWWKSWGWIVFGGVGGIIAGVILPTPDWVRRPAPQAIHGDCLEVFSGDGWAVLYWGCDE